MSINPIFIFLINQLSYKIMAHQLVPTITKNDSIPSLPLQKKHRTETMLQQDMFIYLEHFGTIYRVWFKIKKGERNHVNPGLITLFHWGIIFKYHHIISLKKKDTPHSSEKNKHMLYFSLTLRTQVSKRVEDFSFVFSLSAHLGFTNSGTTPEVSSRRCA